MPINSREHTKDRNCKMASIVAFVITMMQRIENTKLKLCGFPAQFFSPEAIFERIDVKGNGYLTIQEIKQFLGNGQISDQSIMTLIDRYSSSRQVKLTYLGYLSLLKPFFNKEMAQDLIIRDSLANNPRQEKRIINKQIMLLVNEIFLLNCVLIQQHEELKMALLDEHLLNVIEVQQIISFNDKTTPLKTLCQFLKCYSEFQIKQEQIKYILPFIQGNQWNLNDQKSLTRIFLPTKQMLNPNLRNAATQTAQYPDNYGKTYLNKNQFISTTKYNFLQFQYQKDKGNNQRSVEIQVKPEEKKESIFNDYTKVSVLHSNLDKMSVPLIRRLDQSKLDESKIEYSIAMPKENKIYNSNLKTPILEQFMSEKNIKINVGREVYKLDAIEEQSSANLSAIQIVDYGFKEERVSRKQEVSNMQHSRQSSVSKRHPIFNNPSLLGEVSNSRNRMKHNEINQKESSVLNMFIRK